MEKTTTSPKRRASRSKDALAARAAEKAIANSVGDVAAAQQRYEAQPKANKLTVDNAALKLEITGLEGRVAELTNVADAKQVRIEVLEGTTKSLQSDLNYQSQLYADVKAVLTSSCRPLRSRKRRPGLPMMRWPASSNSRTKASRTASRSTSSRKRMPACRVRSPSSRFTARASLPKA